MHRPVDDDRVDDALPEIVLRIPGLWSKPEELMAALPQGAALAPPTDPDAHFALLMMPDGGSVEVNVLPADDEFAGVFASSCQRAPSQRDREVIENYKVNVCLSGPGGSFEAAHRMMRAGAVILQASGAGVFIDNSGLAHGSDDWHTLTNDPDNSPEGDWGGVFWGFVSTIRGKDQMWSVGMHVMGLRDAIVPRTGDDELDFLTLHNFLGYSFRSGANIVDGDLLGDELGPRFRAVKEPCSQFPSHSPMFNSYGLWRLLKVEESELEHIDE